MVHFQIFQNELGFIALDSNGNTGYGFSSDQAIADLQLAYEDADFDVFDITFEVE